MGEVPEDLRDEIWYAGRYNPLWVSNCEIVGGASGGPLFLFSTQFQLPPLLVLGIHSYGSDVLQKVAAWENGEDKDIRPQSSVAVSYVAQHLVRQTDQEEVVAWRTRRTLERQLQVRERCTCKVGPIRCGRLPKRHSLVLVPVPDVARSRLVGYLYANAPKMWKGKRDNFEQIDVYSVEVDRADGFMVEGWDNLIATDGNCDMTCEEAVVCEVCCQACPEEEKWQKITFEECLALNDACDEGDPTGIFPKMYKPDHEFCQTPVPTPKPTRRPTPRPTEATPEPIPIPIDVDPCSPDGLRRKAGERGGIWNKGRLPTFNTDLDLWLFTVSACGLLQFAARRLYIATAAECYEIAGTAALLCQGAGCGPEDPLSDICTAVFVGMLTVCLELVSAALVLAEELIKCMIPQCYD